MTLIENAPHTTSFTENELQTVHLDRLSKALSAQAFSHWQIVAEKNNSEPEADEDDGETIVRMYD